MLLDVMYGGLWGVAAVLGGAAAQARQLGSSNPTRPTLWVRWQTRLAHGVGHSVHESENRKVRGRACARQQLLQQQLL
jgi:hypothetical protein